MADRTSVPQAAPSGSVLASALESAGITPGVPASAVTIDGAGEATAVPDRQAILAELTARANRPGELKWRLTSILYPSILLIFVALYVSSLASGIEPEMALLRAGGASLVLAVLARVAVGIIADETRLVLNDSQIVAMARSGGVRDYLSKAGIDPQGLTPQAAPVPASGIEQPPTAAQAAGSGGKE
jgi:hypothetical protein